MKIAQSVGTMVTLAALAGALSPKAVADDAGWYIGFNAGQSRAKIDNSRIADDLLIDGFTTTSIGDENRHFAFKTFGGYEFNRYFALESGYFDLGRFGFRADTLPPGSLHGDIKIKGANFDAVGSIPMGDKFSLFARAGLNYANSRDSFVGTGAVAVLDPSPRRWAANYKFGFGGQYDFTRSVGMRIEAERYRVDDAVGNKGDIDLYSAGLVFKFGRSEPAPVARAVVAEPEPVAAAPPPPPPPPLPPPPPVRKHVSFSADSLFDFGKDTVRPAGKVALNEFAAELRGAQFEFITVTGHTDRIGSHAYNLALSARRAESVKYYLVETAGIPGSKVFARGVDGEDPVTKADDCPGRERTPKLIACLQPDRRVDVEVAASRLQAAPTN
ncbi:MAG: OmpA-OmpF porin, family [Gammaproteobacteria bacterium]|nr:OmpA-OmpF porin, family [Gammaproteobacteria bacterium]